MAQQDITLTISTDETNLILEALGNLPFVRVYVLIGKIQQQAAAQINRGQSGGDPMPAALTAVRTDE